ncbi:MAG: hypothetical protein FWD92_04310 [Methanomassiliicoccaceae archaeon]|nr:hypothetical protein [Methanomassiliicoccaceae archaeon]
MIACMSSISTKRLLIIVLAAVLGGLVLGLIVGLIIYLKTDRHIMAANEKDLRVFDVKRKTKKYLGTYSSFRRDEINEALVKGSPGSFNIKLRTTTGDRKYQTGVKFEKHYQRDQVDGLRTLLTSNFNSTQ